MSIHQEFVFETDDVISFEKMLYTIVPIVLSEKGGMLTLNTKPDYSFDDTAYFNYEPGPFIFKNLVLDHKKTYGGAAELVEVEKAFTKDYAAEIAYKEHVARNKKKPNRKFICMLSDDGNSVQRCKSYTELCGLALKHVRDADPEAFFKECGPGYTSFFNCDDGSIDHGYRIQGGPSSGGIGKLYISMVHIYYGK